MEPSVARIAWAPGACRPFAVVGAALFVASSLAVASDSDSDGIPDDVEAYTARNMVAHEAGGGGFPPAPRLAWDRAGSRRLREYGREDGGGVREAGTRLDLPRDNVTVTMSNVTTLDGEPQVRFTVGYTTNPPGLFTVTVAGSGGLPK